MAHATTALMFTGAAEAAMTLYAEAFDDFAVQEILRWGPDGPGAEGTVMMATATLGGHGLRFSDSPDIHAFGFTPSISLFVGLDRAAQDRAVAALQEGGTFLMPLGDYGFSPRFCWLEDRFGVSWQLHLEG